MVASILGMLNEAKTIPVLMVLMFQAAAGSIIRMYESTDSVTKKIVAFVLATMLLGIAMTWFAYTLVFIALLICNPLRLLAWCGVSMLLNKLYGFYTREVKEANGIKETVVNVHG